MGIWNLWIKHNRKGIQNTKQWVWQTCRAGGHWVWFQKNKFPSFTGTGLNGYHTSWSPSGWVLGMLQTDGCNFFLCCALRNSSPPACPLWWVLNKTCTNEIATQIQGWIYRWDQQYFLLRLRLFHRHQPAKVPKVFMKFMTWTITITWIWAEWLWIEEQRTVGGKERSPNNLILETISY